MEITEQYSFNEGEYTEYSSYEVVQYMVEQDMTKEHIVGCKLEIIKLEQCIDKKTIKLMENILYNRCEDRFDEQDYLSDKLDNIWKQFEEIKMFYASDEYYTITEEDYNEVIKDL